MQRYIITFLTLLTFHLLNAGDYTRLVDPRIGSGGHGHVFVGANVPFGMVQLGPTSVPQEWDWCSGYHSSDSTVIGFSHTHFSGTGIGDLFDITIMPICGSVNYQRGNVEDPKSGLWSYADRSKEITRPGYYSVPLTRYGVTAELTATERTGFHRYTFPASDSAAIVFDLAHGGCWDRPTEYHLTAVDDRHVEGYRHSRGWAPDQKVYFAAELSKPFDSFDIRYDGLFGTAAFKTHEGEQILLKVALSPTSIEAARRNLQSELPGWDFDSTRDEADMAWERELSRVKVQTDDPIMLRKFYTALYHTMFAPVINSDIDGTYRGADKQIHSKKSTNYTLFSLWDTYRAEMPLLSIVQPERYSEMINSMIDIGEQQGRLPVWFFWSNETDCMVGNPGVVVVADAVVKKMPGVNAARAYKTLLTTVADTARGGGLRQKYGFIPSDLMTESVAYDMEYAIADAAVARAAAALGDSASAARLQQRSLSYRNYLDPTSRFARGRLSDGSWRTPFDPRSTKHRSDDYCEGNAWQYTWLAPHDIEGLTAFFGSKESMVQKLDSLFTAPSVLVGDDASPDISGLIGQYAHGNEPDHHVIYFYTMLGRQDKAADLIRHVADKLYTTDYDGLAGNEDAGQMSAWLVMSAMGFYQVEPASGRYWFGTPLFERTEFAVPGGSFVIRADGLSGSCSRIGGATLNGKPYDKLYINHSDIAAGGELVFHMTE